MPSPSRSVPRFVTVTASDSALRHNGSAKMVAGSAPMSPTRPMSSAAVVPGRSMSTKAISAS